jgi:hypothetical protein
MLQRQEEVSDVEIILKRDCPGGNQAALAALRDIGLHVTDVDDADGAVEGTLPADRLEDLKRLPCVATVRGIYTYLADEADDAGAGGRPS